MGEQPAEQPTIVVGMDAARPIPTIVIGGVDAARPIPTNVVATDETRLMPRNVVPTDAARPIRPLRRRPARAPVAAPAPVSATNVPEQDPVPLPEQDPVPVAQQNPPVPEFDFDRFVAENPDFDIDAWLQSFLDDNDVPEPDVPEPVPEPMNWDEFLNNNPEWEYDPWTA